MMRGTEKRKTYVKSPVASGALTCSSVKNLVRVTMSVLMPSWPTGGAPPLFAILEEEKGVSGWVENGSELAVVGEE